MTKEKFTHLLTKNIGGSITETEKDELHQTLLENPRLKAVYDEFDRFMQDKQSGNEFDMEAKLNDVWDKIAKEEIQESVFYPKENQSIFKKIVPFWIRIVAVIIFVAGISWFAYHAFSAKENLYSENLSAEDETVFAVLDDGSQVWLSPHSQIIYNKNFGAERRKIRLSGKAFFDVAHNAAVPFTVNARDVDVTVKGTAFNVNATTSDVEVALFRGLVDVKDNRDNYGKDLLLHPNQKVTMHKGKSATTDSIHAIKKNTDSKDSTIVNTETKWITQGNLVFQKQRLADLTKLMEKRYGVSIYINNKELTDKRFTGIIQKETLKEMLEALQLSYPFAYEIKGKQVIIH